MLVMEGRDARFTMGYNMLGEEMFPRGIPGLSRQQPPSQCGGMGSRGVKRSSSDVCFDGQTAGGGAGSPLTINTDLSSPHESGGGGGEDMGYTNVVHGSSKKTPPPNGKKTKGRVKIKMEYIDNKLRRYTTFSKRKTGIMKKAYELSTLTGTQVMLLVASETGHVYTFATRKLQPMITSEAGKALIQTCLNSPDPAPSSAGGDQRMSATGFEETELTYNISDEEQKEDGTSSHSDGENSVNDVESLSGGDSQGEDIMACDEDLSTGGYRRAMYPNNRMVYAQPPSAIPNGVIFSINSQQVDPGGVNGAAARGGNSSTNQRQQQYITLPFQLSLAPGTSTSTSGKDNETAVADLSRPRK